MINGSKKTEKYIQKNGKNFTISLYILEEKLQVSIKLTNNNSKEKIKYENNYSFRQLQIINNKYCQQFNNLERIYNNLDEQIKNNNISIEENNEFILLSIEVLVKKEPEKIIFKLYQNNITDFHLHKSNLNETISFPVVPFSSIYPNSRGDDSNIFFRKRKNSEKSEELELESNSEENNVKLKSRNKNNKSQNKSKQKSKNEDNTSSLNSSKNEEQEEKEDDESNFKRRIRKKKNNKKKESDNEEKSSDDEITKNSRRYKKKRKEKEDKNDNESKKKRKKKKKKRIVSSSVDDKSKKRKKSNSSEEKSKSIKTDISTIRKEALKKLSEKTGLPMVERENLKNYVNSRTFFTKNELQMVKNRITKLEKNKHAYFDLLYRASVDKDYENSIIINCDGIYPQLILFYCNEGQRFGIYIEKERQTGIFGNISYREVPGTSFLISLNSLKTYDILEGKKATDDKDELLCFGRSFLFNENDSNWFIFTPRNEFLNYKCMLGDKENSFGKINIKEIVGKKNEYSLKDVEIYKVIVYTDDEDNDEISNVNEKQIKIKNFSTNSVDDGDTIKVRNYKIEQSFED